MSNDLLIQFLNDMITKLEQNELKDEEILSLYELWYKLKFLSEKHNDKDILKYLSLGYYIYSNLENK